jgi:hypothetical protein
MRVSNQTPPRGRLHRARRMVSWTMSLRVDQATIRLTDCSIRPVLRAEPEATLADTTVTVAKL